MNKILQAIFYVLNLPLIPVGRTTVTLAMLIYILVLFCLLIILSRFLRRKLVNRILEKSKLDKGMQNFFAMFLHYSFVGIGGVIILNTAGIEMTALTVVAGALGLGLSLGLQTLAKNVAGGMMILTERPIKIGDRIQIGTTIGDVTHIALRATTVRNDDHVDVIVPNADFMDQRVSNWSFSSPDIILNIPIVVSSDNDQTQVKDILENAAMNHAQVLADPQPQALLESFESGKLKFNLRVKAQDYKEANKLKSDLNLQILKEFKESQIKLDPAK